MAKTSRFHESREARRGAQFSKFKLVELNLVPLVDTLVSIVFFALTTATVGELAPVAPGVSLPEARIGTTALREITLGVGRQVSLAGSTIMNTVDAAQAQSNDPQEPLLIPPLYDALRVKADSIRSMTATPATEPVTSPLAIQGDRSMHYDLLSRIMQTARLAGFRNLSLQVRHVTDGT